MTIVEGRVANSKAKEFEKSYALLKNEPLPPGLKISYLTRSSKDPEIYRVHTTWESREALEEMRRTNEMPAAVAIFKKVGVTPNVEIYDIVDYLP